MTSKNKFYEESTEGVTAVLDRMWQVIGKPFCGSYAAGLDVNENTIKTWRRRGEVSTKYLKGFAAKHNVSLDYLMRGDAGSQEGVKAAVLTADEERAGCSVEVLNKEEQALLDNYRNCKPEGRAAVEAVSVSLATGKKKGRAA